jgi:hypothetical protein
MKKVKIGLGLFLLFVLGFMAGSFYSRHFRGPGGFRPFDMMPKDMEERIIQQLSYDLVLSKEQVAEAKRIFSESSKEIESLKSRIFPQMDKVRKQTIESLQKILSTAQQEKFRLLNERREKFMKDRRFSGPPHDDRQPFDGGPDRRGFHPKKHHRMPFPPPPGDYDSEGSFLESTETFSRPGQNPETGIH